MLTLKIYMPQTVESCLSIWDWVACVLSYLFCQSFKYWWIDKLTTLEEHVLQVYLQLKKVICILYESFAVMGNQQILLTRGVV